MKTIENSPKSPSPQTSLSALLRLTKPLTSKTLAAKTLNKDKEEAELKQQILSTLLSEEKPIEGFKKYLDLLIIKKTGKNSEQIQINTDHCARTLMKEICKDSATLKLEEKLQTKLRSLNKDFSEKHAEILEESTKENESVLESIRKKNHKIIHTSQKLKTRMKLEKVDKEKLFNARTMKHFSNLDTFINAKEFLEQINPFYRREGSENDRIRAMRLLTSVKRFQSQISSYFDEKINDFMQRVQENQAFSQELPQEKLKSESQSSSSNSSFSKQSEVKPQILEEKQYFDRLYKKVRGNEAILKKTDVATQKTDFFEEWEKKKHDFRYLQRNSLFIRHNMGNNPEFLKAFKEFYNPSGNLRKNREKLEEKDQTLSKKLMKQLVRTEPGLNLQEFQAENGSIKENDEFFEKTLGHFSKQQHFLKSSQKKNVQAEKSSIKSLETLVKEIITEQKGEKNAKKSQENELSAKYQDFKEKASNVLKLIAKTSKIIFNEKNKSFAEGKRSFVQKNEEKLANIKENRRKALTNLDLSNIFSLTNRENPATNSKVSNMFEKPRFSEKQPDFCEKAARTHSKTVSFPAVRENSSKIANFCENPAEMSQKPHSKRFFVNRLNQIINQTQLFRDKFRKETQDLKEIQKNVHSFFNEQNNKLKPRLESLAMTFDPIKIKQYHKKVRSFYREKVRKEKQKQVASYELYKE